MKNAVKKSNKIFLSPRRCLEGTAPFPHCLAFWWIGYFPSPPQQLCDPSWHIILFLFSNKDKLKVFTIKAFCRYLHFIYEAFSHCWNVRFHFQLVWGLNFTNIWLWKKPQTNKTPTNFDLFIQTHTSDLLLITSAKLFIILFCYSACKLKNTEIAILDFENKVIVSWVIFLTPLFLVPSSSLALTLHILRKLLKVGAVPSCSTVSRHNKSHDPQLLLA